jgi:O-antigen ligase
MVEAAIVVYVVMKREKRNRALSAIAVFLVVVVGLLVWLGGSTLIQRVNSIQSEAHSELSGGTRIDIDRDSLKMFAKKPVLGWGLGTFPEVYPQFRSFYTNFFVNEAHNDYAQLLTETGAIGFAIMLWLVTTVYRHGLKKLNNWTSDTGEAVSLAALLGITGILIHSFVDFNLQVPANAALFYVLCAVAAMEPGRFGQFQRRSRRRVPRDVFTQPEAFSAPLIPPTSTT